MSATEEQKELVRASLVRRPGGQIMNVEADNLREAIRAILADSKRLAEVEKAAREAAGRVWRLTAYGTPARVSLKHLLALLDAVPGDTHIDPRDGELHMGRRKGYGRSGDTPQEGS